MSEATGATKKLSLTSYTSLFLIQAVSVILAWVFLFYFNQSFLADFNVNPLVCWIFLPAFIRMLAVMLFDWAGVLGLMVGAFVTRDTHLIELSTPIILAIISGLGPYLSVRFCQTTLKLSASFEGLSAQHLFVFALAGSVINTGLNHAYYLYAEMACSVKTTFIPMLIGDFLGTLIMLYLAGITIKIIKRQFLR